MRTACLLAALVLTSAAFAEVPLVVGGEARAIVVVPAEPAPVAQYAAEELVHHVAKATGVTLPIFPADVAPDEPDARVLIGRLPETYESGIDVDALDEEEAAILTAGEVLFIVGDDGDGEALDPTTRAGTLWGVYELLERELGVAWMWPGELGIHVPASDTVVIGDLDLQFKPHLLVRRTRSGIIGRESITHGFTEEGLEAYRHAQEVFLRRHRQGATYRVVEPVRGGASRVVPAPRQRGARAAERDRRVECVDVRLEPRLPRGDHPPVAAAAGG